MPGLGPEARRARAELLDKYAAEDRFVGNLLGVRFAEAFRARGPLLVPDPGVFLPVRFGRGGRAGELRQGA